MQEYFFLARHSLEKKHFLILFSVPDISKENHQQQRKSPFCLDILTETESEKKLHEVS